MVVEAAFWFIPWCGGWERRMVEERERACDEAVVEMGSRPGIYAESLLKACRFCVESPLACVSGITGADLSNRVLSIMTLRLEQMSMGKKIALALFGVLVIATPILLGQSEAAQRVMLAAVNAAPSPFRTAAHAMIAQVPTPSTGLIAEVQAADISDIDRSCDPALSREPGIRFEVVSIHPTTERPGRLINPPNGDGLTGESGTLNDMIRWAFDLGNGWGADQFQGAPKGFTADNYAISRLRSPTPT